MFSGRVSPPDFAQPVQCISHYSPSGQARRAKTDCFVLVGNVEVWGTSALVGDVQAGSLDSSVALARAGVTHLERLMSGPLVPPIGRIAPDEGNAHANLDTPLQFGSNPPSSGTHYPTWIRTGLFSETQESGYWVHSLEHGYIVVLYNCPAECPELIAQLQQFYDAAPKSARYGYQKLVVTPYATMPHRLGIVAWGRDDEMDEFDAERLSRFYQAYHDSGPEEAG